jgi:hypothetical protein
MIVEFLTCLACLDAAQAGKVEVFAVSIKSNIRKGANHLINSFTVKFLLIKITAI